MSSKAPRSTVDGAASASGPRRGQAGAEEAAGLELVVETLVAEQAKFFGDPFLQTHVGLDDEFAH